MDLKIYIKKHLMDTKNRLNRHAIKRIPDNILVLIEAETGFMPNDTDTTSRLQLITQGYKNVPRCKICGNDIKVIKTYNIKKFCSNKCAAISPETKEKAKQTNLKRYGVENPYQSEEIKNKIKKTNLERLGVEAPAQSRSVQEKAKKTNLERYGVENPYQSEEIKNKIKKTNLERYCTELGQHTEDARKKRIETNMKKYGVRNPAQNTDVKNKIKDTNLERYSVENVWCDGEKREKMLARFLIKHGTKFPTQNKKIKEKVKKTNLKRYGNDVYFKTADFKLKARETFLNNYGTTSPSKNEAVKEKIKKTNLERYGVENFSQRHIDFKALEKLKNKDWLTSEYVSLDKTLLEISSELNVSRVLVRNAVQNFEMQLKSDGRSNSENEISSFISSIGISTKINDRTIIYPREIDIYIPDHKIGIEFDGLYWHSEALGTPKNYHLDKTIECESKGIRLIHIFENEWINKRNIVESRIKNVLGKSAKIHARKTIIKDVSAKEKRDFINQTHIQGDCSSSINIGLYYVNNLVSVMTFGRSRFNKRYEYELLRFSNAIGTSVVGGASKMFKHFIRSYNPSSIVTYSDKRWNTGMLYKNLGFNYLKTSKPNYWYFKDTHELHNRIQFQKHKLSKILKNFNPNLTEWDNMRLNNYNRVWDCGNEVFIWKKL
jgi:hypothetical protein